MEKIVNVKKQEWRLLRWLLLFFFFESIGTEIMDILAVSTFLKEAGIRNLPLVYIIDEILLVFFLISYGMVVDRFDRARFVNYLQIGFAGALVLLFAAIQMGAPAVVISVLLYVLKSLIISVLEEAFWLMNDDLFDVQEAKRLYPIINLGGVAGGMVGGALVAALLATIVEDTNTLIVIAPLMLAAGVVFIHLARRRAVKEGRIDRLPGAVGKTAGPGKSTPKRKQKKNEKVPLREGIRFIRETPLFKFILIIFILMGVVAPLGDWMFAAVADTVFTDRKSYATFLAIYKTSLTLVIFVAQLFLSSKILTRLGLTRANLFSPVNNVIKFSLLLGWFKLGPVIYTQGSKKLLEKVVTKPAQRILFGFAPRANKGRIKIFIKTMKGNAAIATLVLLFAVLHLIPIDLDLPENRLLVARGVAMVCALLSLVWLITALRLKSTFTSSLMDILQKEEIDFGALEREDFRSFLDRKSVDFLLTNLESGDDKRAIFIAGLLEEIADERVLDPVIRAYPKKSVPVQVALVRLVGRVGGARARTALQQLSHSSKPEVRAEAVTALGAIPETDAGEEIVPLLNDPDDQVRSAAAQVVLRSPDVELRKQGLAVLQGMLRSNKRESRLRGIFLLGELGVKRNKRLLEGTITDPDPEVRLASLQALVKLVAPEEDDRFLPEMEHLLRDNSSEIRLAAAAIVRAVGSGKAVNLLEGCLDQRGYKLRRLAVEGLVELGDDGRMALVRAVSDSAVDLETREYALQQVWKSGWGDEEMRTHFIPLAQEELREVYLRALQRQAIRRLGEGTESVQLLRKALDDLDSEACSLCISIITTMANPEKIKLIRKALASGTRQTRANVLELLENASEKNLFNLLTPLLDQAPAEQLRQLAHKQFQADDPEPESALRELIGSRDLTVRLAAIFAVGDLGLTHFAGELHRLRQDPFAAESMKQEVERALRALARTSHRPSAAEPDTQ